MNRAYGMPNKSDEERETTGYQRKVCSNTSTLDIPQMEEEK